MMEEINKKKTPTINRSEEMQKTPISKQSATHTPAKTPATATKFVERSLHDLDDLIQKRRLELSSLRKSNRKKLTDRFAVSIIMLCYNHLTDIIEHYMDCHLILLYLYLDSQTPSINRSINSDRQSITLSDIQTPKLNFDLRDQDLLSYATPVSSTALAAALVKPVLHHDNSVTDIL
jgi:hypothetical protein